MATPSELAERALRKLKVLGATETASPEDLAIALQSINDAHNLWSAQRLLRWTLDTIPQEAELGYVLMAAFLCAPDFNQPQDGQWSVQAQVTVQIAANLPTSGDVYSEDF